MKRAVFGTCLTLLVLTSAPRAFASLPFPEDIKTQLMLTGDPPPCTYCHLTLIGGLMTVTKPFGRNLQTKYGVTQQDLVGLRNAIMQADANRDDVDGDGVTDINELRQGTDPNVPNEGGIAATEDPRYGCYCSAVGGPSAPGVAGAAWLSGLLFSVWRRRRTMQRRGERET